MVRSPDGLQVIPAIVPKGCQPGETFHVKFPTRSKPASQDELYAEPGCVGAVNALDNLLTPELDADIPEVVATLLNGDDEEPRAPVNTKDDNNSIREAPDMTPIDLLDAEDSRGQDPDPTLVDLVGREDDGDLSPSPANAKTTSPPYSPPAGEESEQKVLFVRVPPGMPVGSVIHVEIPGENRTVAATVPTNVSSFHVCYTPRPQPLLAPPKGHAQVQRDFRQAPRPEYAPPQFQSDDAYYGTQSESSRVIAGTRPAFPEQKLLLVRVPPNTAPGSTVHVSVPDEPGRILAAIVPGGGVREFHISYQSRSVPVVADVSAHSSAFRRSRKQEPPAVWGGRSQNGNMASF